MYEMLRPEMLFGIVSPFDRYSLEIDAMIDCLRDDKGVVKIETPLDVLQPKDHALWNLVDLVENYTNRPINVIDLDFDKSYMIIQGRRRQAAVMQILQFPFRYPESVGSVKSIKCRVYTSPEQYY